jgi:hypothetical protein
VTETTGNFAKSGYALLRNLVPEALRSFLYEYALKTARNGRLQPGDSSVPGTPCCYSDPFMESFLEMLQPRIEANSGYKLYPTYSYFRVYKHGDILKRHEDRFSCEVSVTASLGYAAEEPWPIWMEVDGVAKSFSLEAGDALLYKGIAIPHWRDRFMGEHAVQTFLHYVDQDGPHRDWKYDKRKGLTTSPLVGRIMEQFRSSLIGPAMDKPALP